MSLNRDYEYEAKTGVCSYCGRQLELDPAEMFYSSCLACDSYDEWEWVEDYPEYDDDPLPDGVPMNSTHATWVGDIPF